VQVAPSISGMLLRFTDRPHPWYPDWALRYQPIARQIAAQPEATPVLEIGANAFGLRLFLARGVIATDLFFEASEEAVDSRVKPLIASAVSLPVRSMSIDALVCVDTFEHLTVENRRVTVQEVLRVLRPGGRAWIAFPCGKAAEEFDRELYESLCEGGTPIPIWLEEHMANPFPTTEEFLSMCDEASYALSINCRVKHWKHGSLWLQRKYIPLLLHARAHGINLWLRALLKAMVPILQRANVGTCYREMFELERFT
jgi:SAM-dependent methyltransferase